MNVPVILRERKPDGNVAKVAYSVPVDLSQDTVADVLEKVSTLSSIPGDRLHIILGGCRLQLETSLQQLQLGPSTSLLALVVEANEQSLRTRVDSISLTPTGRPSGSGVSSFFVYCKSCKDVKAAKLRVHCSKCDSTSVEVQREPERWSDVLRSGRIPSECFECPIPPTGQRGAVWARFEFKCTACNEPSAALQHLRLPTVAATVTAAAARSATPPLQPSCCICFTTWDQDDAPPSPLVDLRCGHLLCLPCFGAYVKTGLKTSQFSLHPLFGYTTGCPWPTCKALVKDPHHFAIAGKETYSEYKSLAVEAFLAEDAIRCAHCDVAFIWDAPDEQAGTPPSADNDDEEEERRRITCPHCTREFCGVCRREPCTCEDEEAANRVLFEATTKMCPRCSTRTERAGGCAHIHCTSCGEHWCFVCVGPWTEECQWNHWFS